MKPRGALWVVIRTAQGAKSWQKRLAEQFGACETLRIESGYRILRAEKSA
jgi:16S rRNA G1207 methylase RsmC